MYLSFILYFKKKTKLFDSDEFDENLFEDEKVVFSKKVVDTKDRITKPILTLNTWQHIAMTYADGTLSMYKNGILIGDTAAAGIVSNANVDFNIGNVVFTGATFWLTGRMDETSFWSRELSASEIRCMPTSGIDTASSGLIFYYKYNQGIASGVNTAITTLNDEKGAINGTLNGFALTGAASNFVAGYSAAVTNTFGFTCPDVAYTWNGQQYTTQGTYQDTLVSAAGCDSIVQLQLVLLLLLPIFPSLTASNS
jgi:hypothetical protein